MTTKKIDFQDLHFEHRLWLNELKFFEDEIVIFEHRLEELVRKELTNDVLAQLEQYQNQFIRQKEVLDELKHDVRRHEQHISKIIQSNGFESEVDIQYHLNVRDRMATYKKLYSELKEEFYQYLSKWL